MKTLTVRLPDELAAQIEAESRARKISKSDVVRDRLALAKPHRAPSIDDISDLIGSVEGLPADLSSNIKQYLKAGYGRKRPR
jgi:Arc/MetJ-type ribon-helix-helix transcriptional regulator